MSQQSSATNWWNIDEEPYPGPVEMPLLEQLMLYYRDVGKTFIPHKAWYTFTPPPEEPLPLDYDKKIKVWMDEINKLDEHFQKSFRPSLEPDTGRIGSVFRPWAFGFNEKTEREKVQEIIEANRNRNTGPPLGKITFDRKGKHK